jgi:hypothetical protein
VPKESGVSLVFEADVVKGTDEEEDGDNVGGLSKSGMVFF